MSGGLLPSIERVYPGLEAREKKAKHGETMPKALDRLDEVVKAWEEMFGEVRVD